MALTVPAHQSCQYLMQAGIHAEDRSVFAWRRSSRWFGTCESGLANACTVAVLCAGSIDTRSNAEMLAKGTSPFRFAHETEMRLVATRTPAGRSRSIRTPPRSRGVARGPSMPDVRHAPHDDDVIMSYHNRSLWDEKITSASLDPAGPVARETTNYSRRRERLEHPGYPLS